VRGFRLLAFGIFALAVVLGYVVAASGTPVASIAIPATFGLVVAALGLVQAHKKASAEPMAKGSLPIEVAASDEPLNAMRYGGALLCFALGFGAGLPVGARARLDNWFAPMPQTIELTWIRHSLPEPPSGEAAIYWLYVQSILQARGLSDNQIKVLYVLQAKDWSLRTPIGSSSSGSQPSASVTPQVSQPKNGFILEEIMKQMQSGSPIANQPPRKAGTNAVPG